MNAGQPMTPQERALFEQLPDELKVMSPGVSMSFKEVLGIAQRYLRVLYGDRADWDRLIGAYDDELEADAHSGALYVSCCDKLPELTEDDLDRWLAAEAEDEALAVDIANTFAELQDCEERIRACEEAGGPVAAEDEERAYDLLVQCAGLLGVTPQLEERAWYGRLIDREDMTDADVGAFYRRLTNNDDEDDWAVAGGNFSMLVRLLAGLVVEGQMLTYGGESVVTQMPGRFYFRGENAYYGSSRPGLFRGRTHRMQPMEVIAAFFSTTEAGRFLDQFDAVKSWPPEFGSVRYDGLMQHYGLKTNLVDLTTDLPTALFFACCTVEDGTWRPLRQDEFLRADSRRSVYELGGDSRFAVLYRNRVEIENMRYLAGANSDYAKEFSDGWHNNGPGADELNDNVIPIGYQPFMRCSAQHGHVLWASDESYDLYRDGRFEKFRVRLTESLCQRVFDMMDAGAKAFPASDIPGIEKYLRKVDDERVLSEETILVACARLGLNANAVKREMRRLGYQVRQNPKFITEKKVRSINGKYGVQTALERAGVTPVARPMVLIGPSSTD